MATELEKQAARYEELITFLRDRIETLEGQIARLNGDATDDSLKTVIKALRESAGWLTMDHDTIDNAIGNAFERLADNLEGKS